MKELTNKQILGFTLVWAVTMTAIYHKFKPSFEMGFLDVFILAFSYLVPIKIYEKYLGK